MMNYEEMQDDYLDKFEFTSKAWENLYDVVDDPYFREMDSSLIYQSLKKRMKLITFGEYLQRYIYRKAELEEPFDAVPLKEYQLIIQEAFQESHTPKSFTETSAKLSALCKNWLTQQTVKRNIVFLLGFGLGMDVADVNEFLTKGLREQEINAKNPFEVICWYCYKKGYGYLKFQQLYEHYEKMPGEKSGNLIEYEYTIGFRKSMRSIQDDTSLMMYLKGLKADDKQSLLSVSARKEFDILYEKAKECIAEYYNRMQNDPYHTKNYTKDDITEAELEHVICSAIPSDKHGNLKPAKNSNLNTQFAGKRFSRQRISDILSGKSEVNRFDLITLNFFLFSQSIDQYANVKKRYDAFIVSMNDILESCCLAQLYIANPYECFILMCMLSEDPLATYADVLELSYSKNE